MKKIINGKKYDTDTAECVGHDSFGCRGDFRYWFEQLYQKQTGEFFIYGEGGPFTKYGKTCTDSAKAFGENIYPLTIVEAQEWVERHLSTEDYEDIFGEVSE